MFRIQNKLRIAIGRRFKPQKRNTIDNNREEWSKWDWSNFGEEWSNNPEWKASMIEHVLVPNVPTDSRILEIGPGAGRWTQHLITRAKHIILVDLTPKCIEICRQRFRDFKNIEYFVNDGKDLGFIQSNSIDCIWSWDVFVHIQSEDTRHYVKQFSRILSAGGKGIIHHSKKGRSRTGWRSDMTAKSMKQHCNEYGLKVIKQFDSWDDDKVRIWPGLSQKEQPDIISVFSKA
jgi:ubiquinone/menaquinone biosynthesis C-methylase UbiE